MAKVTFPESWPLGEVLDRRRYRLLGTVTHKGGHNSGHYESFRRQVVPEPFSTPHSFGTEGVYSVQGSPNPSAVQSPKVSARNSRESGDKSLSASLVSPSVSSASNSSQSTLSLSSRKNPPAPTSAPQQLQEELAVPSAPSPTPPSPGLSQKKSRTYLKTPPAPTDIARAKKASAKKRNNRWWRISDEKVKEARTNDVLGMQKEVYLLFYELDRTADDH